MSLDKSISTSFLAGTNITFLEELYLRFLKDPSSLDEAWRVFFTDLNDKASEVSRALHGASWAPREDQILGRDNGLSDVISHISGSDLTDAENAPDFKRAASSIGIRAEILISVFCGISVNSVLPSVM